MLVKKIRKKFKNIPVFQIILKHVLVKKLEKNKKIFQCFKLS